MTEKTMQSKKAKEITLSKAVEMAIDSFEIGDQFGGYELKSRVIRIYPKKTNCYIDTILRVAREVARDKYKCINIRKGIYERI